MPRARKFSDEAILDATRASLAEDGPNASLHDIAERLGVTASAILKRMGSKEELLKLATETGVPPFIARMLHGPTAGSRNAQLIALLLDATRAFHALAPGLLAIYVQSGRAFAPDEPNPLRVTREALAVWLLRANPKLSRHAAAGLADALLGAIEARGIFARVGGPGTFDDEPDHAWVTRMVEATWPATGIVEPPPLCETQRE